MDGLDLVGIVPGFTLICHTFTFASVRHEANAMLTWKSTSSAQNPNLYTYQVGRVHMDFRVPKNRDVNCFTSTGMLAADELSVSCFPHCPRGSLSACCSRCIREDSFAQGLVVEGLKATVAMLLNESCSEK